MSKALVALSVVVLPSAFAQLLPSDFFHFQNSLLGALAAGTTNRHPRGLGRAGRCSVLAEEAEHRLHIPGGGSAKHCLATSSRTALQGTILQRSTQRWTAVAGHDLSGLGLLGSSDRKAVAGVRPRQPSGWSAEG